MLNQGQAVGVRYKIIKQLGGGGFGETYLAEDIYLRGDRRCVVKRLKLNFPDPRHLEVARRLFDREADTLGELGNHNQIPRLLAHFEENQQFFLVQEFVDGHNLDVEIRLGVPKPESYALKLVWDILEILAFVHQHDVIHRDLKPANIMRRNTDGKLVLIDFGAVKQVQQQIGSQVAHAEHRPANTIVYTVDYAPPELLLGKPYPSSDIYSVGIIAIQALTGKPRSSFDEANGGFVWRDYAQVNPAFADVLDRMTRTQFYDRYQTVEAVIRDLEPLLFAATPQPSPTPGLATTVLPNHAPVSPVTKAQSADATRYQSDVTARSKKISLSLGVGIAVLLSLVSGSGYGVWRWHTWTRDQAHLREVNRLLQEQEDLHNAATEANKITSATLRQEAKVKITENLIEQATVKNEQAEQIESSGILPNKTHACFRILGTEPVKVWERISDDKEPIGVIGSIQPGEIVHVVELDGRLAGEQAWIPGDQLELDWWFVIDYPQIGIVSDDPLRKEPTCPPQ